jgi:hypothetical protein
VPLPLGTSCAFRDSESQSPSRPPTPTRTLSWPSPLLAPRGSSPPQISLAEQAGEEELAARWGSRRIDVRDFVRDDGVERLPLLGQGGARIFTDTDRQTDRQTKTRAKTYPHALTHTQYTYIIINIIYIYIYMCVCVCVCVCMCMYV